MLTHSRHSYAGLLGWIVPALLMAAASGQEPARRGLPLPSQFVGSYSCSAVACHGAVTRQISRQSAGNEFMNWMQSDPHAKAAATISTAQFEAILVRLGAARDRSWDKATYQKCARCHDPQGIEVTELAASNNATKLDPQTLSARGIGCESCHGPARNWLSRHYERGWDQARLAALGLKPLTELPMRAQVCAECHVGSAENDMNHDMIAAGHPALRFEMTSYHGRLPKHWRADRERQSLPDFEAQLWAAGQYASAAAAIQTLHGRASRAAAVETEPADHSLLPWPELSEYRCLSCHQPIRIPEANRLNLSAAGSQKLRDVPAWSPWVLIARRAGKDEPAAVPVRGAVGKTWSELSEQMERFSEAQQVAELTGRVLAPFSSARSFMGGSQSENVLTAGTRSFTTHDLLEILRADTAFENDWETSCQLFLGMQAALRSYRDRVRRSRQQGLLTESQESIWLAETTPLQAELESLRLSLSFSEQSDWPRGWTMATARQPPDSPAGPPSTTLSTAPSTVRRQIAEMAEVLKGHLARLESATRQGGAPR